MPQAHDLMEMHDFRGFFHGFGAVHCRDYLGLGAQASQTNVVGGNVRLANHLISRGLRRSYLENRAVCLNV